MTEKSMRETMEAAFDEAEKRADEVEAVEAQVEETDDAPAEEIEQKDASPASDDDPEHVEDDTDESDGTDTVLAPDHWSEEDRTRFEAIADPEARRMVLDVRQSIERGYNRKFEDLAEERRQLSEWDKVFAPVDENLRLAGINRAQAVQRLLAAQQMLDRDPRQGLAYLAQQYGVNLNQPASEQTEVDPVIAGLQSEVHGLKSTIQQRMEAEQQQRISSVQKQIEDFRSAVGEDGKPLHPHFEKVQEIMARLADANPDADLKSLYDQAVYADPTTRAEIMAAEQRNKQLAEARKAKEKAQKARKAATPQGEPGGRAAVKGATLRESLELAYDKAAARS